MSAIFNAIRAAQNAIACPVLAANDYVLGSVGSFVPGLNAPALAAINALRKLYGCDPGDDVQPPLPEFTGGQCVKRYNVTLSGTRASSCLGTPGPFSQIAGPIWGPITGAFVGEDNCPPGSTVAQGNINIVARSTIGGSLGPLQARPVAISAISVGISNVTVVDGTPDNCGDPEPVYPPPINYDIDVDITYNNEEGDEVNVTIPFIFTPIQVDFNGTLRMPFTFDFGGNTFTGNFSLDPEFSLTINPPGLPPGTGQGTEDLPPGDPGDEVEPVPPDQKIIGVVVTSSIVGEQQLTTIATQNVPSILAPRAGSIKFAYSIGVSTFWSNDIDVKGDRVFIPCPFSQGADFVAVSPAPGIELDWVPIRGYALATTADIQ